MRKAKKDFLTVLGGIGIVALFILGWLIFMGIVFVVLICMLFLIAKWTGMIDPLFLVCYTIGFCCFGMVVLYMMHELYLSFWEYKY